MLNVGDTIEIGGRKAIVCYETKYNDANYICVAFETDKIEYDVYEYKYENDKLLVSNELSEDEMKNVLAIFVQEGLEENSDNEELNKLLDKISEKLSDGENEQENN